MDHTQLTKTFKASFYAEQVYSKHQEILQQDFQQYAIEQPLSLNDIQQLIHASLADISDEILWMKALRVLRARLMFRWIYQDANQLVDVVSLTQQLSDFADECVRQAKQFAYLPLVEKYGEPMGENGKLQDLIVIAMGKHGAQELNLSSDIDLIFAFDENGETTGRRCIDVQKFCTLWGQKLIYLLDNITVDGFVFRVDMRLRPWGDGSPLVLSYAALEKYLSQHGREWERYAWIKARIVTGGAEGEQLLAMTRPFVFRRYVDFSAFSAIREMKAMIEKEVQRRNLDDDVKLGAGGIRDVEFIVQAFQLIYGGSRKELQDRQCLVNLQHLANLELIEMPIAQQLKQAYLFLRRVEHAIQALNDQQTQELPSDETLRSRLAETLGFTDWVAFIDCLNEKRTFVHQQFKLLMQIEQEQVDSEKHIDDLEQQLFASVDENVQKQVQQFWQSANEKLPKTALERLKKFWPLFIEAVIHSEQPSIAVANLLPLIESILRRSVYLVMLIESKGALQRLVKMATISPWICEELRLYPVLLDELLTSNLQLPQRSYLQDLLRQQLLRVEVDHVEDYLRIIRLFKKSNVLTVAASDVLAESHLMKVSDALTDIAEVCVESVLQFAYRNVAQKYGYPVNQNGERCGLDHLGLAVIAYGKLGGIELGYGSDLDLVFIHNIDEEQDTNGSKEVSGLQFITRVVQKMINLLTTQTLDGRVYEIDTRLRPSGDAGLLVSSLKSFEQYQRKNAWVWEHQALVRARSVAGDKQLREAFEQVRKDILTLTRDEESVRNEVLKMRQKMREHLGSSNQQQQDGIFNLKHDTGGIVDIEFITQYLVLAWSHQQPALAHYSDNVRILEAAAESGCISHDDAHNLIQAYLIARAESHTQALANHKLQVDAEKWRETRQIVLHLWQRLLDKSINVEI